MSTERIDVLHVVGAGCDDCRTKGGLAYITIDGIAFDAQKVAKSVLRDAAMAELIEADMALDSANHAITTTDPQSEDAETMEAMRAHRNRMIARRRKALAACGGAP